LIEEPVAISKDVYAAHYIDDQEERCRDSQRGKNYWIDFC
jgi:hypothetical protein